MLNFAHLNDKSTCRVIAKVSGEATSAIQNPSPNQHVLVSSLRKLSLFVYRNHEHRFTPTTSIFHSQSYVNIACTVNHMFLPYVCSLQYIATASLYSENI